jgi:hypothetical protein
MLGNLAREGLAAETRGDENDDKKVFASIANEPRIFGGETTNNTEGQQNIILIYLCFGGN